LWYHFSKWGSHHKREAKKVITEGNSTSATIVHRGQHAVARLAQLGLLPDDLVSAVLAAEMERRSGNPLEPSIAAGFRAWATGFRVLAELLVQRGWIKVESLGLPRILKPDTAVAIAVLSGDIGTGRFEPGEAAPRSKTPRGNQSIFLVHSNEVQLHLPFVEPEHQPLPPEVEQLTWWLLIYSDHNENVRAELSLPVGLGQDGRMSIWEERIIIDLPNFGLMLHDDEDEEPPFDLDIDVQAL
jgi:hypothetical protein